jgi:signal transduction histidine kinase/ActR/RegA family two-component response regulator
MRVLVLAPTGKDAALTVSILRGAGIDALPCPDLRRVCDELEAGAGALLLTGETLGPATDERLQEWLRRQAPWSDLPVLVFARPGTDSAKAARATDLLGNVTVLERPTRIAALVSAVCSALRARRRQYETRAHLARIEQSEVELRNKAEELAETHRRKDEFLAILAHELRNPLAPIRNALDVLRLAKHKEPATERVCEILERQVSYMVRLVDDLLEVSRITRGKIELRREVLDLSAVLRDAVETSRPLIDAARHELRTDVPPELLTAYGDPVRLAQVFANLLNNAAKYTEPGGRISLTVRREGGGVAVSVRDNGIGIPPPLLPRVLDPFTQIRGTDGRGQAGLGIGLMLVKTLVEMHGGSVQASTAGSGCGSEFTVRLPLVAAERKAAEPRPAPRGAKSVPHRILVVDDNEDAADTLGVLLRMLGADVRVVYGGREALDAIGEYRPSAVLLDLGMPGMSGEDVARRVRARPEYGAIRLVALTGWGQAEDKRRTAEAGFDHHLVKPADMNALTALLGSLAADADERQHSKVS